MTTCSCPPCNKPIASRLQAKLTYVQRAMLGYFCKQCILNKCDSRHKK